MKQQAFNPYLPSYEYVPDGEPHVFGDRVYVYGSHDRFNGDGFCLNSYVCWSAPLDELGNWKYEGVIFKSTQNPSNKGEDKAMNAPDVVQGADGRYYLYYQGMMAMEVTVAVADQPQGPYEYYGHVHHPDGKVYGSRKGDSIPFDPGMFRDEDGRVYMYIGTCPDTAMMRFMIGLSGKKVDYSGIVELDPKDMLTVISKTHQGIPNIPKAKGTPYEGHGFYEASSMRKINGIYYYVYSSVQSHDLCYATSKNPTGPWKYGGVLVSIGDIGLDGVTSEEHARNFTGNTHGGMVCIRGQWYIFYHRQTNQQMCCRQGCAEPVMIKADGSMEQVEVTSCGLNGGPLPGEGRYEARIACNLWGKKGTFKYTKVHHTEETGYPYFTQTGEDRELDGDQYIAQMSDGATAGYKYFDFDVARPGNIAVSVKGDATGIMKVYTNLKEEAVAEIRIQPAEGYTQYQAELTSLEGIQPMYFVYEGTGSLDFTEFRFI